MNHFMRRKFSAVVCLAAIAIFGGCHKKVASSPPPPPPPPPAVAPTANITVSPSAINQGQPATLRWSTTNAASATISGIGAVSTSGSQSVYPSSSTTYTLTARGAGGNEEATARVTVTAPAPKPAPLTSSLTEDQLFGQNVHDTFFDYDKADLRSQDTNVVQQDATFLAKHPDMKFVIGAHCDERGSEEYNVALGQRRAESLQKALVADGVSAANIRIVSYGKEKPFCTDSDEHCWQQNRRDHLKLDR